MSSIAQKHTTLGSYTSDGAQITRASLLKMKDEFKQLRKDKDSTVFIAFLSVILVFVLTILVAVYRKPQAEETISDTDEEVLAGVRQGLTELREVQLGKRKGRPIQALLDEL